MKESVSSVVLPAERVRELAMNEIARIEGERARRTARWEASLRAKAERMKLSPFGRVFRRWRTVDGIVAALDAQDRASFLSERWWIVIWASEEEARARRLLRLATSGAATVTVSGDDWRAIAP